MIASDFEQLISDAGLILLSNWPPRFLVSLHVEQKFGVKVQTGAIVFSSQQDLEQATVEEGKQVIAEVKKRLLQCAGTLSGDIDQGTVVKVATKVKIQPSAINYPAH